MAEITIRISDRVLKAVLLVVAGVTVFLTVFALDSLDVFAPKYQVKLFVPEVQGIGVGAPVRLDGIQVGRVSRIELAKNSTDSNRRIEVGLRIEKRYHDMIRAESSASLATDGLLGSRYVNIQRGLSGPPIKDGEEIQAIPIKEMHVTDLTGLGSTVARLAGCLNDEQNTPMSTQRSGAGKPSPSERVNP